MAAIDELDEVEESDAKTRNHLLKALADFETKASAMKKDTSELQD